MYYASHSYSDLCNNNQSFIRQLVFLKLYPCLNQKSCFETCSHRNPISKEEEQPCHLEQKSIYYVAIRISYLVWLSAR